MAKGLTDRQKHILHFVLDHDEQVGVDDLVRRLEVSRRTIQRDLSAIQSYLEQFRLRIDIASTYLSIDGNPSDVQAMLKQTGKLRTSMALTPKNREQHVAMDLLMEQGPSKLGYFGRQFNVTAASLSQNLDDVDGWLEDHGLQLIRRRGYGVEVEGDEERRREAIAELIYNQASLPDLMSLLRQEEDRVSGHPLNAWFVRWFGIDSIQNAETILTEELEGSNPPLDEASFYGFMLHVLLATARMRAGASLPPSSATIDPEASDIKVCARIIRRMVPDAGNVLGEASFLAKHLRGAKVLMTEETRILPLHITAIDLAYRMTKHLALVLDMPLAEDRDLIVGMAQHLEPAIHRMTTGLLIRNPLLEEIERRYPSLFQAMRSASDQILKPFGLDVPDSEVGYLTMHLGASYERRRAERIWRARIVCPNGISSAELLASRFRKEFPYIRITSLGSLSEQDDKLCDFIVSTVPLEDEVVPVITVSPFLTLEERAKIQSLVEQLEYSNESLRHGSILGRQAVEVDQNFIEAEEVIERVRICTVNASDLLDLIGQIADDIVLQGESDNHEAIVSAILHREQLGSIVLPGKRLSVLHARTSAITRCQVIIYRCVEPLHVIGVGRTKESVDTILVMLALEREDKSIIRLLGRLSSALVIQNDMIDVLRTAPLETVRQSIREAMYQIGE